MILSSFLWDNRRIMNLSNFTFIDTAIKLFDQQALILQHSHICHRPPLGQIVVSTLQCSHERRSSLSPRALLMCNWSRSIIETWVQITGRSKKTLLLSNEIKKRLQFLFFLTSLVLFPFLFACTCSDAFFINWLLCPFRFLGAIHLKDSWRKNTTLFSLKE